MATRLERVVVDIEDRLTRPLAGMAVKTRLLANAMDDADGNIQSADRSVDMFGRNLNRAGPDIDRFSGRLRILAEVAASLGPALIPVGAIGIPAVTGLAASLGFTAVAGGTLIAAFQGVGDALDAVNKAAIEPTEANLEAARKAMADLSPQARQLVGELRSWIPALKELRDTAAAGLFPGLTEGLDGLESALPRVERILAAVSTELGDIAADAGESLGGERWAEFLDFIATDTPPALRDMATATGNIAHAMGELWMAFDPLNDDFLDWVVKSTDKLDDWAAGLSQTEGFEDFVAYIRENGPQVADTMGAIATAVIDILEAAAPLGGPALKAIEGIAKGVSAVADSDMGTPIFTAIAAVSALNLLLRTTRGLAAAATTPLSAVALGGGAAGGRGGRGGRGQTGGKHLPGAAVVPGGGGGKEGGRSRKPGRRRASSGEGPGLDSVAWVLGAAAGLDYVGNKLSEVGEKGQEAERTLRDFAVPKTDPLNKFFFGDAKNTLNRDLDRVLDGKRFSGFFSGVEEDIGRALGGTTFTKSIDNVAALDDQLIALSRTNPAKAMDAYYTAARKSGLTTQQLAQALPKATRALQGQAQATGDVGSLLRQTIPQLGRYDRLLRGFPSEAITEIAANGIPETRRGIIDLTAKYNLTPRQVRTLIRQQGGEPTRAMVDRIIKRAEALNRQRPNPRISAADQASPVIRRVGVELDNLNGKTANTYVRTIRVGRSNAPASPDVAALGGIWLGGVQRFAVGGMTDPRDRANNHQPELAGPGQTRVWREPETRGEAYIPLADDYRRPRAQAIAAETVSLLGGTAYFADGGRVGGRPRSLGGADRRKPRRRNRPGGKGSKGANAAATRELERFRNELEKARDSLERERSARDDLIASTRDNFRRSIFDGDQNAWAAGAGDPRSRLRTDIANANAFQGTLATLRKQGVSGQLLAEIAASGDMASAASLSGLGAGAVRETQSLYNQRAAVTQALGNYAGGEVYGASVASLDSTFQGLAATVKRMEKSLAQSKKSSKERAKATGKAVADGVNKGAVKGRQKKRAGGRG